MMWFFLSNDEKDACAWCKNIFLMHVRQNLK